MMETNHQKNNHKLVFLFNHFDHNEASQIIEDHYKSNKKEIDLYAYYFSNTAVAKSLYVRLFLNKYIA